MPRGDRTGPAGMGPMTGRGAGFCSGSDTPGFMNRGPMGAYGAGARWSRGGVGAGGGRGWRNRFYATGLPRWMCGFGSWGAAMPVETAADEKAVLKQEANNLKSQLDGIQRRLDELDADASR